MSRLFPLTWVAAFAAALMPLTAYEAYFVLLVPPLLAASLSFAVLKYPFAGKAAPVDAALLSVVFAFWGVAFLSVVLSEAAYTSYLYFCFFSAFPLSLCCALAAPDKDRFFHVAGAGVAAIFAALGVFSIVQFFTMPDMLLFGRVRWPFADPNALAGLLTPGFFCAFGVMIAAQGRFYRNAGLAVAVLIACVLLVAGSRGSIFSLTVCLAVFAALTWPHIRRHARCTGILAAAAAAMLVLTQTFGAADSESTGFRFVRTLEGKLAVLWERPAIWGSTWEIIRDHFWTGTGIGTFFLYYDEYRGADYYSAGRMAHNDPLQFWAEMGVFAPVLFYGFAGLAVFLTARALRAVPRGDARRVKIAAPFCALGAVVLHTHITFHFHVLSILMLVGVLTGYWFREVRAAGGTGFAGLPMLRLPPRPFLKVALIVPLLAAGYAFLMLQGGYVFGLEAQRKLYAADFEGFARAVNRAAALSRRKDSESIVLAVNVPLGTLESAPSGGLPRGEAEKLLAQGMGLLDEVYALNPRQAAVPYLRARLIREAARQDVPPPADQETLLREALRINPLYFAARTELARVYLRRKDGAGAYKIIEDGLQWREAATVPADYYPLLAALALEHGTPDVRTMALKQVDAARRRARAGP